ncbi:MAG: OadG family protein [Romboutsia sp.]|uniref:OadG family protein n=1 Tax=Romboutsia sp. TaxID=1965302 RepID=UPI003F38272D
MNISQLLEAVKNPEAVLTIGEKLLVGLSVALLSMSVVFIVLVVIAGIISLLQREKKVASQNNEKITTEYLTEDTTQNQNEIDDMGELVSVITAAICAVTGNNSNNIVVKKIVRSNNSKSSWERMPKSTVK